MQGIDLQINDHSQTKPHRTGDEYKVTRTTFDRKQLTLHHDDGRAEQRPMFDADLQI